MEVSAIVLLFTENCTEETRKSKTRETLCTHVIKFSSLRSSTEQSVESNRIDFPKQIRIKRKYLTERDKFRFHVGSALKIPLDARKPTET